MRHGIITPEEILSSSILGYECLLFNCEDASEFLALYAVANNWSLIPDIHNSLLNHLLYITNGHPGLFAYALHNLNAYFKNLGNSSWYSIWKQLTNPEFILNFSSCRACRPIRNIEANSKEDELLYHLTFTQGLKEQQIEQLNISNVEIALDQLLRKFIIVQYVDSENNAVYNFPAPIIHELYLRHKFGIILHPTQKKSDFEQFIKEVIINMSSRHLEKTLGRSKDLRVLEAVYQKEFYRSAFRLLGSDGIVSCEVGPLFSINGNIDFWINDDRKWAIELLRDGDRRDEHLKRMEIGGRYHNLTIQSSANLVIDFRGPHSPSSKRDVPAGCAVAEFDQLYQHVKFSWNGKHETLHLNQNN